jgi:hypothetical protein
MEKDVVKLIVFNGEDFGYWKNYTRNYLLSQGHAIWEIIQEAYVILAMLENATQGELQRYENNYKASNLITTALGRNVSRTLKLLMMYGLCFAILMRALLKLSPQKPREYLDDCFARFESIMSNLRACGPRSYTNNEHAKQLLYALDDHVWGMKITTLEEYADFATLDTEIFV